jgi:hypothetical protein
MKLQELAAPKPTKQIIKVFESYFGKSIRFDQLTAGQTQKLLTRVRGLLGETKRQPDIHYSERNPTYLKLMMMEQALTARLAEEMPIATAPGTNPQATQQAAATIQATKDPAVRTALEKAAKGQNLTPDEQKLVAGAALMKTESKLRRAYRTLKESEVQQAQVVLAAQDMVDKMQGMLEDVTELQFKELPALVDSIKNQVGIDQAQQFNTDATAALAGLVQNLQGAKQQLDAALGVVTGQGSPGIPGMPAPGLGAEVGADVGAEMGGAPGAEMGAELGADAGAELDAAATAAGGEPAPAAALGRQRR